MTFYTFYLFFLSTFLLKSLSILISFIFIHSHLSFDNKFLVGMLSIVKNISLDNESLSYNRALVDYLTSIKFSYSLIAIMPEASSKRKSFYLLILI